MFWAPMAMIRPAERTNPLVKAGMSKLFMPP